MRALDSLRGLLILVFALVLTGGCSSSEVRVSSIIIEPIQTSGFKLEKAVNSGDVDKDDFDSGWRIERISRFINGRWMPLGDHERANYFTLPVATFRGKPRSNRVAIRMLITKDEALESGEGDTSKPDENKTTERPIDKKAICLEGYIKFCPGAFKKGSDHRRTVQLQSGVTTAIPGSQIVIKCFSGVPLLWQNWTQPITDTRSCTSETYYIQEPVLSNGVPEEEPCQNDASQKCVKQHIKKRTESFTPWCHIVLETMNFPDDYSAQIAACPSDELQGEKKEEK